MNKAPGADLLAYQRKLAQSQIPEKSIYKPGYLDSLHWRSNGKTDKYGPACGHKWSDTRPGDEPGTYVCLACKRDSELEGG